MRRITFWGTAAGRRLAADGGPLIGSRYAKVLVLSATLTAIMVVGLLAFATPSRADVVCQVELCLEKTATPDPVVVGEPLTFTIIYSCTPPSGSNCAASSRKLTDTLPAGVEFVSATATGYSGPFLGNPPQPTCSESAGTVTCAPVNAFVDTLTETDIPFVATIEVIPTQCGIFTNTASLDEETNFPSVSETFTVVGCVPTSKEQCKEGGYGLFGSANQGRCIKAVKPES
jgi:uncharacterized repeat protein (TIGR01451 family)